MNDPGQAGPPPPSVVRLATNPPLTAALRRHLVALWSTVAANGGAVGVVGAATPERVEAIAVPAFERVARGADDLVVAFESTEDPDAGDPADEPVAFGLLETNDTELTAHRGRVRRLQRHPRLAGRGVGAAVLAGLEDAARRRGLVLVTLSVRGGTGREHFYLDHGYRLDGRLPDRLQLSDGTLVEELRLSKPLGPLAAVSAAGRARGGAVGHVERTDTAGAGGRRPPAPLLPVRRLDRELPLPAYAHPGDAGLDLHSRDDVHLEPGERVVVGTGVAVALPDGHVGLVHPRSGLGARHGVTIVNAPGTIDAGYRGEVKVTLLNTDRSQPVALPRGSRIAQLVVQRVETVRPVEVDELPGSARGTDGFGSTGR